jgi:hypothetical protein
MVSGFELDALAKSRRPGQPFCAKDHLTLELGEKTGTRSHNQRLN